MREEENIPWSNTVIGVAHDLRLPLTTLQMATETLLSALDIQDMAHIERSAAIIERATRALQHLVENLIYSARIANGRLPMHREPLNLLSLIDDVESIIRPLLEHKRQSLRVEAPIELPDVLGDRQQLQRVLVNLVGNATKFGPEGEPIDLILATRYTCLRLSVADRGPGLPPGSAEAIFEPFVQGAAPVEQGDSVGLGLTIVREIIRAHDGRVGVDARPGGGTCFWFEVPVESGPVRHAPQMRLGGPTSTHRAGMETLGIC